MIESEFKSHPVWGTLDIAKNAAGSKVEDEYASSLGKLIDYFRWILESSDAAFVAQQELDGLNSELSHAIQTMRAGEVNKQRYNQAMQQLTPSLTRFPYPRMKRIFRSEANDIISGLETDSNQVRENLRELTLEGQTAADELRELKAQAKECSEIVERAVAEIESNRLKTDAEIEARLTEAISSLKSRYTEEKNHRIEEFQAEGIERQNAMKEFDNSMGELSKKLDFDLENIRKRQLNELSSKNASADNLLKQIDALFQEAGQTVLAGGFAEAARNEKKRYENDALFAKISFVVAAVALGLLAMTNISADGTYSWDDVLKKVPISVLFAAPGIYFASLAAKHRKEANRLRSLGLRINSFAAFVKSLQLDEAKDLRAQLAPAFFSEGGESAFDNSGDLVSDKFLEAAGKIADKLPKIAK